MKYFDLKVKNREQEMCGFRTDTEKGLVFGMFLLLAVITIL